MSKFTIIAKRGLARAGVLKTAHGEIKTPVFMPVGTQATVKAISPDDLKEAGTQIILGNTYHLYLRPGSKLIREMGGLHKFMGWDGPILTDSGGFQAFSLGAMIEHGVRKVPRKEVKQFVDDKQSLSPNKKDKKEMLKQVQHDISIPKKKKGKGEVGEETSNKPERKNYEPSSSHNYKTMIQFDTVSVDNREKSAGNREKEGKRAHSNFLSKILTDGVEFKSHLDGSIHMLTPQKSIEVQLDLGSDIILVLDELLSPLHTPLYVSESIERTHRWELESKKYFDENLKTSTNPGAMLFGILQGVYDKKIREDEARWIAEQGFDGVSIGGSFGTSEYWPRKVDSKVDPGLHPKGTSFFEAARQDDSNVEDDDSSTNWAATKAIYETVGWVTPLLPEDMPRHILGIGEVEDFFECIERGADMFDCVSPTRRARNGSLYISPKDGGIKGNKFTLNIGRAEYKVDSSPIDSTCGCYTCKNFTRSYLRHLFMSSELLFHRLATIHNVHFMLHLVEDIRESIINDTFDELKKSWLSS